MSENSEKETIGLLIKKEREKQGFTQDKFATLIDIDPRNLSKIEHGKNFPSFFTFLKIVEILKIEPNYFLSFVNFEKTKENPIDKKLFQSLKFLSDEAKLKITELIETLAK